MNGDAPAEPVFDFRRRAFGIGLQLGTNSMRRRIDEVTRPMSANGEGTPGLKKALRRRLHFFLEDFHPASSPHV